MRRLERRRGARTRTVVVAWAALAAILGSLLAAPVAWAAEQRADPLRALGAQSPLCEQGLSTDARRACEGSGAVESPYPLDRYRFDWHIDTGITKVDNNLNATLQWFAALVWQAVLYATKAVLLAFQWAFSLDLLGAAMTPVREALLNLHQRTFGTPWMLAAIGVLGTWGVWSGVMRRKAAATVGGLLLSIVLLAGAQAMIYRPLETVGTASAGVNELKGAVLAGATAGTVQEPSASIADASRQVFDAIVLRPWCAIQFGDVTWCLAHAPGDPLSHAERYLRFDVGSDKRDAEYKILADPDYDPGERFLAPDDQDLANQFDGYQVADADRTRVQMQEKQNTLVRCGLIVLIAAGILGWLALLGYLSAQTLLQALYALLLLMFAPVMALIACLGPWGRRIAGTWLTRLAVALVAGIIYALLLAVVLALSAAIGELYAVSWIVVWGAQAAFLWLVFFKRRELLDWLAGRLPRTPGTPGTPLSSVYHAKHLAESAAAPAIALATTGAAAPAALSFAAARRARTEHVGRTEDRTKAVQALAREQLELQARDRLQDRYDTTHAQLAAHDDAKLKLDGINRRLRNYDQRRTTGKPGPDGKPAKVAPTAAERALLAQRKALEAKLMPRDQEGVARKFVETADRNQVEQGRRFNDRQVELQIDELRHDTSTTTDPAAPEHAWRTRRYEAGLPPSQLADLTPEQRTALTHDTVTADIERDRALLAAPSADPNRPDRATRRAAEHHLPTQDIRERAAEHRRERRRPEPQDRAPERRPRP